MEKENRKIQYQWIFMFWICTPVFAAQFTLNIPVNAQFFKPNDEVNVICGLYRQDEEAASLIKHEILKYNEAGDYVGLVTIEFDGLPNPAEITHYSCYTTAFDANDPKVVCLTGLPLDWTSNEVHIQADSSGDCSVSESQYFLNDTDSTHSTGKQRLPIQYEY